MRIGLIDVDSHNYPNLALMKLSTWHKQQGDTVEWWWSDLIHYDIVYMSKVFSDAYTPDRPEPLNADRAIKGGTGYAITLEDGKEVYHPELDKPLPPEVEHTYPDYSLYPELTKDTAFGFLTRGCPRGCAFCHVGGKEGKISRKAAELSEFWRGQKNIILMDPNILSCAGRWELLEHLVSSGSYVDFNQGLDIRLISKGIVGLLEKMRIRRLHFAWDNPEEKDMPLYFERFSEWYSRKDPRQKIVYVLTNFNSTLEQDLYRIYTLRDLGYSPYVMIYNKHHAPQEIRNLQRWCNNRLIFGSEPDFYKYDPKRR